MKQITIKTAKQFNILNRMEKLEKELLKVQGVTEVEFDIDGFYDNIHHVIVIAKYKVYGNPNSYFANRRQIITDIQNAAFRNELKRTGDSMEDYGEHFYFVFSCGNRWSGDNKME